MKHNYSCEELMKLANGFYSGKPITPEDILDYKRHADDFQDIKSYLIHSKLINDIIEFPHDLASVKDMFEVAISPDTCGPLNGLMKVLDTSIAVRYDYSPRIGVPIASLEGDTVVIAYSYFYKWFYRVHTSSKVINTPNTMAQQLQLRANIGGPVYRAVNYWVMRAVCDAEDIFEKTEDPMMDICNYQLQTTYSNLSSVLWLEEIDRMGLDCIEKYNNLKLKK